MRLHVPSQGNGGMIIVENDNSMLFFDMGIKKHGESTLSEYYREPMGYLAENDFVSLDEINEFNIVISHLHSDHFSNLNIDFIENLINEDSQALHNICLPPVDILFTLDDNIMQLEKECKNVELSEINEEVSQLFDEVSEIISKKESSVRNNFIEEHRNNIFSGSFNVKWLAPYSTESKKYQELSGDQQLDAYSSVEDPEKYIRRINKSDNSEYLFPYSPSCLIPNPDEDLSDFNIRSSEQINEKKII